MMYLVQVSMALDLICQYLALVELVEEITSALDNKKYVVGVFVDLKKVFDTVDHDIFTKKYIFLWRAWHRTYVDCGLFGKKKTICSV